jgi:uncharacterized protein (UPF0332 family)
LNDLENCFNRRLLRPVEPSNEKSRLSLKQAREWLDESEKNLENDAYRSAQISTYLALFHSARAILFRDGIREKSHYCIGIYLEKYVNSGDLEEEYVLLFDRMRSARNTDQYSFQIAPSSEEVKSGIKSAGKFISRMDQLLDETTSI